MTLSPSVVLGLVVAVSVPVPVAVVALIVDVVAFEFVIVAAAAFAEEPVGAADEEGVDEVASELKVADDEAETPSISTCILDPLPFLTINTFSTGASVPATAAAAASTKIGCKIRRRALMNQLLIWFIDKCVASDSRIFSSSVGYGWIAFWTSQDLRTDVTDFGRLPRRFRFGSTLPVLVAL